MRLVATGGIVGIAVLLGAVLVGQDVAGWIVGLVIGLTSVVLAALLWSSRSSDRAGTRALGSGSADWAAGATGYARGEARSFTCRRVRATRAPTAGPSPPIEIGADMSTSDQKVMQYLNEAHATELALVRVLQSQIAMTPRGSYREGLERHLDETRDHAERVGARLQRARPGRQSADRRRRRRRDRDRPGPRTRQDPVRSAARHRAARRRSSRTPRTPAPRRRWRSPPTPRSSGSPRRSATT